MSTRESTRLGYRPNPTARAAMAAHFSMDSDAAELSSITTVVADIARRIGEVAERRAKDPDDPLISRLHEIERTLITAQRRLRDVGRVLG